MTLTMIAVIAEQEFQIEKKNKSTTKVFFILNPKKKTIKQFHKKFIQIIFIMQLHLQTVRENLFSYQILVCYFLNYSIVTFTVNSPPS